MTNGARLQYNRLKFGRLVGLEHGYTQVEVAEAIGVTQHHYSYCESDLRRLPPWRMQKLATFYGLSVAEAFPEYKLTKKEREAVQESSNYLAEV
ncbi:MAG: helix-turn-helix transcriptional regulator [Gemmatimonadaceae bacterium]